MDAKKKRKGNPRDGKKRKMDLDLFKEVSQKKHSSGTISTNSTINTNNHTDDFLETIQRLSQSIESSYSTLVRLPPTLQSYIRKAVQCALDWEGDNRHTVFTKLHQKNDQASFEWLLEVVGFFKMSKSNLLVTNL
jgi:hypothetical protein